jgi:murein DD-endopeptidase MepM/ murein hydrolase activator NlpD
VRADDLGFHPLTPLAEREGGVWTRHRRAIGVAAAALALALSVPLLGAALGPAAPTLQPLSGVAGAQGVEPTSSPAAPQPAFIPPAPLAIRTVARDPDGMRLLSAPPVESLTGYQWPIPKGRVSLPFKAIPGGEFSNGGKLFHDGVDMASFCGAPVGAAHAGIVLAAGRHFDDYIGWVGDLGPYYRRLDSQHTWGQLPIVVVIDDGNGYRSMYAHFADTTVKPGQLVTAGQLIGHEGATGHASGCHVHYGLFSPLEKKLFGVRADIVKRMKTPPHEIARVDPLAVLPGGAVALATRSIEKAIRAAAAAPAQTG